MNSTWNISDPARYLTAAWSILTAATSIAGNSAVLVASIKHDIFTIDRVSATLINHIAVADCAYAVYIILTLGYLVGSGNVYGAVPCYLISAFSFLIIGVETLLIAALNIAKLHYMRFPLQLSAGATHRKGHVIGVVIWVVVAVLLGSTLYLAWGSGDMVYLPSVNRCKTHSSNHTTVRIISTLSVTVLTVIPFIVILVTMIWLASLAKKTRGRPINSHNTVALILISAIFFFSYIPSMLAIIFRKIANLSQSAWVGTFYTVSYYLINTNFAVNALIYFFTIRSFGAFVRRRWREARRCRSPVTRIRLMVWSIRQRNRRSATGTVLRNSEIAKSREEGDIQEVGEEQPSQDNEQPRDIEIE